MKTLALLITFAIMKSVMIGYMLFLLFSKKSGQRSAFAFATLRKRWSK